MIDYVNIDLFNQSSVDKQFLIVSDDNAVAITNTELHQGAFELKEKLFSGKNIIFGSCESGIITFTVSNIFTQLKNKWLTVYITLNHDTNNSFKLGRFKVYSDVPTADRKKRTVTAYDALYETLNADVADWYNELLPKSTSTVTLKEFRDSFFAHFGIEQEEIELINDDMTVEKTIQPEELSGKVVLNAICEINGCFGHMGRNGKFKYIYLAQSIEGLYPAQDLYPSENLYPRASDSYKISTGTYVPPLTYENYKVQSITGLQIKQKENDLGAEVGTSENVYLIEDNFLVYGKGTSELKEIAEKILDKIKDIVYRPFNATAKGNPCIEVGDSVRLNTNTQRVETYVFQRVLNGIQSMKDSYSSTGSEYIARNSNSLSRSITQLKGKVSEVERTSEEIRLSVTDLEKETKASLSVLSDEISLKVDSGDVVSEINISDEVIELTGNRLIVNSTNFKLDEEGNVTLEYEDYSAYLQSDGFSITSGSDSTRINIYNNKIAFWDRSGGTMLLGGCFDGETLTIGNASNTSINCADFFCDGDAYCNTLNGYEPITSGNIEEYVDISSLESQIADLEERISALEEGTE